MWRSRVGQVSVSAYRSGTFQEVLNLTLLRLTRQKRASLSLWLVSSCRSDEAEHQLCSSLWPARSWPRTVESVENKESTCLFRWVHVKRLGSVKAFQGRRLYYVYTLGTIPDAYNGSGASMERQPYGLIEAGMSTPRLTWLLAALCGYGRLI